MSRFHIFVWGACPLAVDWTGSAGGYKSRLAIGDVHRDFKAKTQVGESGGGPLHTNVSMKKELARKMTVEPCIDPM
jgi:hypothetical protein